ncbi:MAG: HEPN domain-containing protein [Smithellaceae bacterium]
MADRKKIRKIIGYTHKKQLDNPDVWYKQSVSFHEASLVLYKHQECISGALRIFQYNAALSLELIFKAILAAKGGEIPLIHSLRELSAKADIELDEDQKFTLDLLTEIILWLGRYPAPKSGAQWDNYHDNIFEKHIVRSQSGTTHTTLANQKRLPSMENYTRIWEICLVKYASVISVRLSTKTKYT